MKRRGTRRSAAGANKALGAPRGRASVLGMRGGGGTEGPLRWGRYRRARSMGLLLALLLAMLAALRESGPARAVRGCAGGGPGSEPTRRVLSGQRDEDLGLCKGESLGGPRAGWVRSQQTLSSAAGG